MSELLKEGQLHALIGRLDDLLVEAARLRADISSAMRRRREGPFWPERRRRLERHVPDRRLG
jgi:hypothetical protein